MSTADTKEVIRRFNEEVFGEGKVDLIDELVHEDYLDPSTSEEPMDREGLKVFVQGLHAALSDADVRLERVVVDGDDVAWRWSMRARHTGEFMGVPASDNRIEITGNDLGIMRDGKLFKSWGEMDMASLMSQMGAMESTPA